MKSYIAASLKADIIRCSSSPAVAGFFFVEKMDMTPLPPALSDITVKKKPKKQYPLPRTSTTFDFLQDAKIFTRWDLRKAHHLLCIKKTNKDFF